MKKRLLLLALVSALVVALNAQTSDPVKNPKEISFNEISFHGHVIRLYKTAASGYLYDIFFQNNLVIHQNENPFTGAAAGLSTKEDALKIAKWQIIHLYPNNRNGQPGNNLQKIPIEVARQLNISVN